jgi:hypothetical protein
MRRSLDSVKKLGKITAAATLSLFLGTQTAWAQQQVQDVSAENSLTSILAVVNQLPTYLKGVATMAATFLATDNQTTDPVNWSTNWTNEQTWLTGLATDAMTNQTNQATLQQSLLTSFFGSANITAGNPQNLNDLSYTTLLGQPLLSPDPRTGVNASLNYLTNASSLAISYPIPGVGWRGNQQAQKNYIAFYNTLTAIQTFNAYVLSGLYEDSQTLANDSSLRSQLITQSTNANWFTSVITNDLGWVLRQILLFSSQSYVLMDQLVQTQKQMLATLAMTNSLLIANSGFQATTLISKAQGSSS